MPALRELLSEADELTRRAGGLLRDIFGVDESVEAVAVYVPGRVEFLGKHTDYAGGRSLLMTVERGFRLVAVGRGDEVLRVSAGGDGGDVQQFPLGRTPPHRPGHWVNYVATVARRVVLNFADAVRLRGADVAFISDLPIAAGMSSSSALMVAVFLALSALNGLEETPAYRREIDYSPLRLAEYLGCVENGQSFGSLTGEAGVGTFGGSEDHTAMLCCKPGMLSQFSFAPAVHERDIPFPETVQLVIAASGVEAVKTGEAMEKYNRASLRARKATEAYNRATGADCRHLRHIVERVGADGLAEALKAIRAGTLPEDAEEDLPGRFEQFFREDQQIIPAVADALARGDLAAIGELVDTSHANGGKGLQNQVPETDFLQRAARQCGALAASYFGAGFGGSVWAMVGEDEAGRFLQDWRARYLEEFPARADRCEFFITRPGPPASVRKG